MRLVDFIVLDTSSKSTSINSDIKKKVKEYCRFNKINLISLSGQQFGLYQKYFSWMGILPVKPLGPSITLKDVNMNERFSQLMQTQNWAYSLGDMELF